MCGQSVGEAREKRGRDTYFRYVPHKQKSPEANAGACWWLRPRRSGDLIFGRTLYQSELQSRDLETDSALVGVPTGPGTRDLRRDRRRA